MHIMHVAVPGEIGGLERVVQMLATAQQAAGNEVRVVGVFPGPPDDLPDRFFLPLRAAGVTAHTVRVSARGYQQEHAAIGELCRKHKPDVVHLHGYRPDVVDAPAARAAGAATVTTVHGFTGGDLRNRLYEWVQRRAIRRCDAVVAVARSLVGRLLRDGVPADRMHLVVNAWRPSVIPLDRNVARQFLGAQDAEFSIGWVGRLTHEKGLDILLRALPSLDGVPYKLHVIGNGSERGALEKIAHEVGIAARVVWHGVIPNAERLFAGFDAFVLSSRTEGTPIVLLEAMAASVPVVATRVGGIPDLVSEREALLVAGLDPHALATAIQTVFVDPRAAARRARAARLRLSTEYRERTWVERYHMVYEAARANASVRP